MPSKSKRQQRYMGMLYHCKETGDCPDKKTKRKAKKIKKKYVRDFAGTKHKGLPERVRKKKKRKSKKKKSNFMTSRLIKLANELDVRGLTAEADLVDDLLKYADEDKRRAIKVAAKEILKPGFVVMGHGTALDRAESIVQNGFTLRGHPISRTFLLMTDSSSLKKDWYDIEGPQAEDQLAWWPYGESSMGSIGVAIMRLPESIFSRVGIGEEGTKMFSVDPEKEDDRERGPMADPIGIGDEYKRKIPNYFFFALWNQKDAELILNPNYDESKILKHLSIDESEVALPEKEHYPVTTIPEDSDFEVW